MSWRMPLFWCVVVLGGAGAGLWWFTTRPVTYVDDRGFSVDIPHGWEVQKVDEEILFRNPFASDGGGSGKATFHPHPETVDWPAQGLQCFRATVKWQEEAQIGEKRGLLVVFEQDGQKFVGAVVDRGDAFIAWSVTCDPKHFDDNRSYFERCGGGIRCIAK